jgi:hypothetical protein
MPESDMAYDDDGGDPRDLRDEGMHRVLRDPEWMAKATAFAASLPTGWVGLAEDIRLYVIGRGLAQPHHPNVWGAFINSCIRLKMFERVDDWDQPKSSKSHASAYRKLRRT